MQRLPISVLIAVWSLGSCKEDRPQELRASQMSCLDHLRRNNRFSLSIIRQLPSAAVEGDFSMPSTCWPFSQLCLLIGAIICVGLSASAENWLMVEPADSNKDTRVTGSTPSGWPLSSAPDCPQGPTHLHTCTYMHVDLKILVPCTWPPAWPA